jgi:hypothetical protein
VFYQEFSSAHGGNPPKDEAEFREFLATKQERLDAGGIDADGILKSPKSGTPWVVAYGSGPVEVDGTRLVAYESAATDGKRVAITERGGLASIDDAKLQSVVGDGR